MNDCYSKVKSAAAFIHSKSKHWSLSFQKRRKKIARKTHIWPWFHRSVEYSESNDVSTHILWNTMIQFYWSASQPLSLPLKCIVVGRWFCILRNKVISSINTTIFEWMYPLVSNYLKTSWKSLCSLLSSRIYKNTQNADIYIYMRANRLRIRQKLAFDGNGNATKIGIR